MSPPVRLHSASALGQRTWPELATGVGAAPPLVPLLVPLGSTEQHGPHLPLDTDTRIAVAVAERAAAHRPGVLVAPAWAYGASGEHAGFPGTLSIGTEALAAALVELGRSSEQPLLLVNGHGGNADAVRAAVALLVAEGRGTRAWAPRIPGGDPHAGRTETSIMLHLAPQLVRLHEAVAGPVPTFADLIRDGVRAHSPSGVLGDPAGASAAEGERLLAELVEDLCRML